MTVQRIVRPSVKLQTKYYLTMWICFVLFILPFVLIGLVPEAGLTYVAIFLAANVAWLLPAHLLIPPYFRSISYELTDQEIIVRKGIFTKSESVVPYHMVTNAALKRGPLDRWLGIGTVEVHTAGFSQQATPEAHLSGLQEYESLHQELLTALHRFRQGVAATKPAVPSGAALPQDSAQLLQAILEELKALRAAQK